ncbi:hypothetical protein [Herbaspirillum huttiense]|uniref:Uncharacterized protein n=2 Tax=Herbaspirillum huttiense TaxID=863372 RepID=A0AAJ2LWL8_9BURK|nr:hypothetical protein [Herbaspirillum huttiense]MDR9837648.1 hypothetical protein [Herbaspirillum huttiense]
MVICSILFILFVISLFWVSFKALKLNSSVSLWMEKISSSTEGGLVKMASLSDSRALKAFGAYFLVLAALAFVAFAALKDSVTPSVRQGIAVTFVVCFYLSGSIGAWSKNREKILDEFLVTVPKRITQGLTWGALASAISVALVYFVSPTIQANWESFFWPSIAAGACLTLLIVFGLIISDGVTTGIIYGPALLALIYLRGVIATSRLLLKYGNTWGNNLLVLYSILFTAYFTLTAMPRLSQALGACPIC